MNEKTLMLTTLLAILAVGTIGFIGMSSQTTGDATMARKQCCCEIDHYDFYGNPVGREIFPPIRAKNLDNCELYCARHFEHIKGTRKRDIVTSVPC